MAAAHEHCNSCFRINCPVTPDDTSSCALTYCQAGCGFRFHMCKNDEHRMFCMKEKQPCLNSVNGCPVQLIREKMSAHLSVCPASVIVCKREWNRWLMYSPEKGWKAPMPFQNPHVKCGQMDVALAMRDQKMLMDSFKIPRKTLRILQNQLTQYYPAVPIQSHSSVLDSHTSETSQLSEHPWDMLSQSTTGLKQILPNQLSDGKYKVDKAFDYVSGKQGLKHLAEMAKLKEMSIDTETETEQLNLNLDSANRSQSKNSASNVSYIPKNSLSNAADNEEEDEFNVYCTETKLFEVLGLDLNINFTSSYEKPKIFTFLCGCEFRRDEYYWHVKNYHLDIQCNLNNWFEQRCPLSYLGCTFAFQRFTPKTPSVAIVHSSILQSFGVCESEPYKTVSDPTETNVTEKEDVRTIMGRKQLREATPEFHTSYKYDSAIRVIPRYKSESHESSTDIGQPGFNEFRHSLTDLPFEVLQNITRYLDSFSIQHLSMTCKLLRSVCCSLLEERGIVSLVWEKKSHAGSGAAWEVAYKKWQFSTSFSPIIDWDFKQAGSPIHEHLKVCPFNQHVDNNVKDEPFQIYDFTDNQQFSRGQEMFDKKK